jgi:hypothetical protein
MFARGSGNAWPLQHYFANPSASAIVSLRRHHSAHLVPTMALITMINQKESKRRSDENEAAVKQQFKNLNYWVERLDSKSSKRRRPDFLISTSSGPLLLCEVKTVDSAFYPRDKKKYGVEHVHISTLDPKFRGSFQGIPIDLTKIDRALADAVRQRAALIADRPETADLPLLVAIFPTLLLLNTCLRIRALLPNAATIFGKSAAFSDKTRQQSVRADVPVIPVCTARPERSAARKHNG